MQLLEKNGVVLMFLCTDIEEGPCYIIVLKKINLYHSTILFCLQDKLQNNVNIGE